MQPFLLVIPLTRGLTTYVVIRQHCYTPRRNGSVCEN